MKGTVSSRTILTILSIILHTTQAQQCYYPNGSPVTAEPVAQCYSWGGACCPVGWTCLSNNLCTYKNQTGRYSCADSNWGSSCPSFCQEDNGSAGGDQAVQNCGGGNYCCNGRGLEEDQCCQTGTSFFQPGAGKAISTISTAGTGSIDSVTVEATKSTSTEPSSTETTSTPSTTSLRAMKTTKTTDSIVSSEGQAPTTVQVTVVSTSLVVSNVSPVAQSSSAPVASHSNGKLEKEVGIPVGIVGGLLIIAGGYFAYMFLQRRRKRQYRSPYGAAEMSKEDEDITRSDSPTVGEFVGLSPVSGGNHVSRKEARQSRGSTPSPHIGHQARLSELGGTEILPVHEEPQVAELPAEGSRKE